MTRRTPITLLGAAAIPLVALAVAGCGGGGSATAKAPPAKPTTTQAPKTSVAQPPKTTTAHHATVSVAKTGLGKVLVDSHGRTLYLFKGGSESAPMSALAAWPPLRASGRPTAGGGAKASLLATSKDAAGQTQVTYNGHPLYTFVKDMKPGDTNGEGVTAFGAKWFAISASGKQVPVKKSSAPAAAPKPAAPAPAPKPAAPTPAPKPAAPAPAPKPAPKPPSTSSGIPQGGGGDGDSDNSGGPSDGDGNI
jgi:predicted lipoprotein with Yx(FWY)xxD motif